MLQRKCDLIYGAQLLTGKILSRKELSGSLAAISFSNYGFHQNGLISIERQGWMSQENGDFARRVVENDWARGLEWWVRSKPSGRAAYSIGGIMPTLSAGSGQALAKSARMGHRQSRNRKQKNSQWKGHPPQ